MNLRFPSLNNNETPKIGNSFKAVPNIMNAFAKEAYLLARQMANVVRKKMNKSILARSIPSSTAGDTSAPITRVIVLLLAFGKIITKPAIKERIIPIPSSIV
jgi:hypothetical protein